MEIQYIDKLGPWERTKPKSYRNSHKGVLIDNMVGWMKYENYKGMMMPDKYSIIMD